MRVRTWLLSLTILILFTACGPAVPNQPDPEENMDAPALIPVKETEPDFAAEPTPTLPTAAEAYPAVPPPAPAKAEGYPVQPAMPAAAVEAYPVTEGFVWMIRPLGIQCEEIGSNDLTEAKAALTAAGINIGNAEMVDLMVCSACGCPTSTHFRIEVAESDSAAAQTLGWEQER